MIDSRTTPPPQTKPYGQYPRTIPSPLDKPPNKQIVILESDSSTILVC